MKKSLPVGLQLYTVRDFMDKDFAGTLEKVKKMGYDYAELAGLGGMTAAQVRAIADNCGVKLISAHVPLADMIKDIDGVISDCRTAGCEYLAVPYLDEANRAGTPNFAGILEKIAGIGEKCAKNGLVLMYHNHDFEFRKMPGGEYVLDYMYSTIGPDKLQTELDTCWVKVGGEDPAAYVRKYAGRCPVVHLKDYKGHKTENMYELIGINKKADAGEEFSFQPVGYGVQDMPSILRASLESGAKYVIVEQDRSDGRTSLEVAEMSRRYLAEQGW